MRALVSVYNKEKLDIFCKGLKDVGVDIISSGGTYKYLANNGISAKKIEELTNFPEILGGRVKTLQPQIHGGILARRTPEHLSELKEHDILPIDIVVVNLYPFEEVSKKDADLPTLIENIDIGGVALIRAAAKNFESVAVLVDPSQYDLFLEEVKTGKISDEIRKNLALEAFAYTAKYDSLIYNTLWKKTKEGFPEHLLNHYSLVQTTRYGENPYQKAAVYSEEKDESSVLSSKKLHGKELSFNNIYDLDSALSMVRDFEEPTVAIIKHTNPCGLASADNLKDAYLKALKSDPTSAFGSIVATNYNIDKDTALEMSKLFIECIIAPFFDEDALEILTQKKNLRLLEAGEIDSRRSGYDMKRIVSGMLVQDWNNHVLNEVDVVSKREPTKSELDDLLFAWTVVKHIKSNAIVFVKDKATVGVGAGQMSRVDSVKIASMKAGDRAKGAVMASDAFFPFRDGVDEAFKAGITAVIEPGGSKRDQEVIDAVNEHGMAMVFTSQRVFKH